MKSSDRQDNDYYNMLGISINASLSEIQKAYRLKALKLHPDKNRSDPTAGEKFHKLQEAYLVLSEPGLRSLYDEKIRLEYERQTRDMKMDEKRRVLRDDLLNREDEAKRQQRKEYQAERAREAFEAALSELRKEQRKKTAKTFSVPSTADMFDKYEDPIPQPDFERALKVTFNSMQFKSHGIQAESMERLWNRYGPIEKLLIFGPLDLGYYHALIYFVSSSSIQNILQDSKASWRQIYNVSTFSSHESLALFINEHSNNSAKSTENIRAKKFRSYDKQAYSKIPFDVYEKQTLNRLLTQQPTL